MRSPHFCLLLPTSKAAVARDRLAQSLPRQGAIRFYGPECRSYAGCIPRQLPQPFDNHQLAFGVNSETANTVISP
jgi:hypothetical protein